MNKRNIELEILKETGVMVTLFKNEGSWYWETSDEENEMETEASKCLMSADHCMYAATLSDVTTGATVMQINDMMAELS